MKRKHELERHNAEAKLQLFKMEQQEEAETALKEQQMALEVGQESKEADSAEDHFMDLLNSGRSLTSSLAPRDKAAVATNTKPNSPAVEGLVKQG